MVLSEYEKLVRKKTRERMKKSLSKVEVSGLQESKLIEVTRVNNEKAISAAMVKKKAHAIKWLALQNSMKGYLPKDKETTNEKDWKAMRDKLIASRYKGRLI